jgi:aryl-alcohol dehydrogenase-like predicted oxidoreductase
MAVRKEIKDRRRIGASGPTVTSVGVGAWSWGDKKFWEFGKGYNRDDLEEVWARALELGVTWFDTAEVYGDGASETIIGELRADTKESPLIATKIMPEREDPRTVRKAAEGSIKRLGVEAIDLYQVHWPPPKMPLGELMREMEALVNDGLVRAVGVSNFSVAEVEAAQSNMQHARIASNQVHYSLLHREPEEEGLVEHHRRAGIGIIAYSPIEQGILTGKFTPAKPPKGFRGNKPRFQVENLRRVGPLLEALDEVGGPHGHTTAQTAMAWLLKDPNVVVIPGAKSVRQLEEDVGCADWKLTGKEIDRIEEAYNRYREAGGV